ncbi:MAG: hypothetical protein ACFE0I_14230 [Elainellaceae cyanobacterium]
MKAYRTELVLTENGALTLADLPFQAGETVEIIVLERSAPSTTETPAQEFPLAGTVLQYGDPFGAATPLEEWDVLS